MADDNQNNAVFAALKPICDHLIVDVTQKSVDDLNRILPTLPRKAIHKFQTYICFPIEMQLLKTSSNQQKQMLVDLLAKLMSLSYIDSVSILLRLSTILFKQVVLTDKQIMVAEVPEELKLGVVNCLMQVWRSTMSDTLYEVYTRDNYPRLSPIVFTLVQLAKNEKLIKLRVAALESLQVLCYVHTSADATDVEMRQRAQSVVMLMLPGIVSCCVSIASEPITQNHKVTVANIQLWSRVVCLVMEDREAPVSETDNPSNSTLSLDSAAERVQLMKQQMRTLAWLKDSADKLTAVTETMLQSQTHDHWLVRVELAQAMDELLTHCNRNMSPSVGSLVCCLIALAEDDMVEVQGPAAVSLSRLSREFAHDMGQPLLQLVESAFYSLLTRAPRIMQGTDESSQLTCMSLLAGFLRLQGCRLPLVLSSSPFLHRLLLTLIHISRVDWSRVSLLEECCIREIEADLNTSDWKVLTYCNTVQKLRKLRDVCCVLRAYADLQTLTHALIDLLDSAPEHAKEVVLLLNWILAGGEANSIADKSKLIKTVVGVYLQPTLWNIPFSIDHPENPASSVAEAQSNIVQVSLLAEGLGLFALAVGGQNFSSCLLRCLYPLLECAGSPLHPLAIAGLTAVQAVARACVGGGVTELIRANVDYLSHHITLRLRRAHQNPGVLSVLSVVMRHTTAQVLPSLHEILEDVLVQSCDEFQEYNANGFLRVFLTFLECLRSWQGDEMEEPQPEVKKKTLKSVVEELREYKRCKDDAENFQDEDSVEGDLNEEMFMSEKPDEEYVEEEEQPKEVAPSVKLTVAVLERSLHFLPSKDEQRQILVLEILREGVLLLRKEEDQLLPIVHKIWSPLVNRFQGSTTQPLVMHRAFQLLCTLSKTAKDFIRSRTVQQVFPALCRTLEMSASKSELQDRGSAYRLSQLYKLQRALLCGLGPLALHLALQEKELHHMLVAVSPYLSARQPASLQELCVLLYQLVASVHPDLVWLQLISLWSPVDRFEPPCSDLDLHVIKIESCTNETSEYKKNVSELLEFLESRTEDNTITSIS